MCACVGYGGRTVISISGRRPREHGEPPVPRTFTKTRSRSYEHRRRRNQNRIESLRVC